MRGKRNIVIGAVAGGIIILAIILIIGEQMSAVGSALSRPMQILLAPVGAIGRPFAEQAIGRQVGMMEWFICGITIAIIPLAIVLDRSIRYIKRIKEEVNG